MKTLINTFLLLCLMQLAWAQDQGKAIDCSNAVTQQDMNFCAEKAYKEIDSLMQKTYGRLMAHLQTSMDSAQADTEQYYYYERIKVSIALSQEQWLEARDANAAINFSLYYMGSIAPMMASISRTQDTKDRIAFLQGLLMELGAAEE